MCLTCDDSLSGVAAQSIINVQLVPIYFLWLIIAIWSNQLNIKEFTTVIFLPIHFKTNVCILESLKSILHLFYLEKNSNSSLNAKLLLSQMMDYVHCGAEHISDSHINLI